MCSTASGYSWEARWQASHTPWDAGQAAGPLVRLIESAGLPAPGRALVPGAGSGYDVLALASAGWEATGVEFAPSAASRFESLRREADLDEDRARMIVADFFAYAPDEPFDLMWDYTFLCAIDPSLRERWAMRARRLIRPGGELICLIFPVGSRSGRGHDDDPEAGPPYLQDPEAVARLVEPLGFERRVLEPAQGSHPARKGREWLGRWRRAAR